MNRSTLGYRTELRARFASVACGICLAAPLTLGGGEAVSAEVRVNPFAEAAAELEATKPAVDDGTKAGDSRAPRKPTSTRVAALTPHASARKPERIPKPKAAEAPLEKQERLEEAISLVPPALSRVSRRGSSPVRLPKASQQPASTSVAASEVAPARQADVPSSRRGPTSPEMRLEGPVRSDAGESREPIVAVQPEVELLFRQLAAERRETLRRARPQPLPRATSEQEGFPVARIVVPPVSTPPAAPAALTDAGIESERERSQSTARFDARSESPSVLAGPLSAQSVATPHPAVEIRKPWLPTTTARAAVGRARAALDRAAHEYQVRALASAEASAWEALRLAAQSIDLQRDEAPPAASSKSSGGSAQAELQAARTAVAEAAGFVPLIGGDDPEAIGRLVKAHQTSLLEGVELSGVTAGEAIDRYLNDARTRLAPISAARVEAAEAMDLLAAIRLARGASLPLAGPISLCLRRAALQGQPHNASLAMQLGRQLLGVGLHDEAAWALQHSWELAPSAEAAAALAELAASRGHRELAEEWRRRAASKRVGERSAALASNIPEIVQLSPQEFAAISRPVMSGSAAREASSGVRAGRPPAIAARQPLVEEGSKQADRSGKATRWRLGESFPKWW